MGDVYTIADPYLFTIARWMEVDSVDPTAFPRVLDHRDRMAERPAVQGALKSEGLA
jgi:glutathione S-transferase